MATVTLENLKKSFGKTEVIQGIDIDIADGEFVVIVGPSGCGKSTLLRMVAGLETATSGEVRIDGKRVNDVEPMDRDIAMVFQNYALYPHMSVFDNMAYGLKIQKVAKPEIAERVQTAAKLLQLEPYLERKPRELSGGQRQRVAMGRAIVRKPEVFLFDEPLSNLDAKLRVKMRAELKELHQKLRTTTIYVTHDQVEAMTLADRIVVLRDGEIEQIGTPLELYDNPANAFVGAFLGSPTMNLLELEVGAGEATLARFADGEALRLATPAAPGRTTVGIRPEAFTIASEAAAGRISAEVVVVEPTGAATELLVRKGGQAITVLTPERLAVRPGDTVWLTPDAQRTRVFAGGAADAA